MVMRCVILVLVLMFSCSNNAQKDANMTDTESAETAGDIVGSWLLTDFHGVICNVCPVVILLDNGAARLMAPSGQESSFSWSCHTDRLTFSYGDDSDMEGYFNGESQFTFKTVEKENSIVLELTSVNNEDKWILSKTKE